MGLTIPPKFINVWGELAISNKKYFWLKLKNDFFSQKEIKKIRQIAGGDTFTIIYLKMQLLSIKDGGIIKFDGTEGSLAEQLSYEIDEDIDNIKITLSFLQSNKLIEQIDGDSFMLGKVPELIGSETTTAERMRKMRDKRNVVTPMLQNVRKSYTEIEKEKELELDIEIDKELELDNTSTSVDYQSITDLYNKICISYSTLKSLSNARKKSIKARLTGGYSLTDFETLFNKAESSTFLKGGNNRNWSANFDWLIKDSNIAKVLDGNYDDKKSNTDVPTNKNSSFSIDDINKLIAGGSNG